MILCPKSPWVLVCNEDRTLRVPTGCQAYSCDVCRGRKITERLRIMVWAASQATRRRMITLTKVPGEWQQARMQLRDFVRRMRKAYHVEWGWAIEPNPKGTGYHAHGISFGEYIPWKRLTELWGGRFTFIDEVQDEGASYITKCYRVCGYSLKSAGEHLALNGNRPVHFSRGFTHGWTSRQILKELSSNRRWSLVLASAEEISRGMLTGISEMVPTANDTGRTSE